MISIIPLNGILKDNFQSKKFQGGQRLSTTLQSDDNWLILDGDKSFGPLTWNEIVAMVNNKQLTKKAMIKNFNWPDRVPLTNYFHPSQLVDVEAMGLVPSRYDAMFYGGIGLFFIGFFGIFINIILAIIFFIISPIIEFYAIYLERKNRPKATTSTLGNICAGGWIIVQLIVTILFISFFL
jgi:hypothetical protein